MRKTVPPTLSLTHLAWVPAGGGMSQVQRSPTASCISSLPSILILTPTSPTACRDCRRCCLSENAGICSLSASPSAAAVFPGNQDLPCDYQGSPERRKVARRWRISVQLLGWAKRQLRRADTPWLFPCSRFHRP